MDEVKLTLTYGNPAVKKKGNYFVGEKEHKEEMTCQMRNAYDKQSTSLTVSFLCVYHWKNGNALAFESYGICEFHRPKYKPALDEAIKICHHMVNIINEAFENSSDMKKYNLGHTVVMPTPEWTNICQKMLDEFNPD